MKSVKIGFAPTRRSIFSAPDAVKYANLTRERLKELGVEFVDITDINEEGLFYDEADREKIQEKFRRENVKGIFFPHGNFGTEYVCARLAKEMGLPVLLWGPRDERPDENGVRLRDSQCGLFATGKVLRRFGVPFTYMTNCRLTDPEFERGIKDFLAVCNVVDTFRHTRILQIGPRPFDFWSTMCNEGELLEKFNIQLSPIPLPELTAEMKKVKAEGSEVEKVVAYCNTNMCVKIKPEELENVAALKVAMGNLIKKYGCQAAAIQCWNQLQSEIGIMPCAANALCNDEGFPMYVRQIFTVQLPLFLLRQQHLMTQEASLQTGPSAILILRTASSFSTADHGRSLLQERHRSLLIRWHSAIREALQQKQSMAK